MNTYKVCVQGKCIDIPQTLPCIKLTGSPIPMEPFVCVDYDMHGNREVIAVRLSGGMVDGYYPLWGVIALDHNDSPREGSWHEHDLVDELVRFGHIY